MCYKGCNLIEREIDLFGIGDAHLGYFLDRCKMYRTTEYKPSFGCAPKATRGNFTTEMNEAANFSH